jgi:hypothetical protein
MKKLLLSLLLFLPGTALATNYTSDSSCQGAWIFGEGSGTTVEDISQNNNNGTLYLSIFNSTNPPKAYVSNFVSFYDAFGNVSCGNDNSLNFTSSNFTVVCWFKTAKLGTEQFLFSRGAYTVDGYYAEILTNKKVQFLITGDSGVRYAETNAVVHALNNDTWYHLACIRNGTQPLQLFLNGTEVTYSTQHNGTDPMPTTKKFNIGAYSSIGYALNNGSIAEMAVFNRVLSPTEINDIMDNGLIGGATITVDDSQLILIN